MKRFDEEELESLRDDYIDAAVELVADEGWSNLTVRNVGAKVGKSGTAIHRLFKGSALKEQVIGRAFRHLPLSILSYASNQPPPNTALLPRVIEYLRTNGEAAPLMAQAAAAVASRRATDGDEMLTVFIKARVLTSVQIQNILRNAFVDRYERGREFRAQALIDWYTAVCVLLVTVPAASNPDLLELAAGFRALRDLPYD